MKIGLLLTDSDALQHRFPSTPEFKIAWILSKPSISNQKPDIVTLYEMDNYPEPLESVDVLEMYGDVSSLITEIAKLMKYAKIISFQTPLSIDTVQLDSLMKSAKDRSAMIIFAHPFLYSQQIREFKKSIDSSVVGEVQSLYIRSLSERTDPFWYHLLVLYLLEELPVSIKALQSDAEAGKGTKYFFIKFKENKSAKSIQHYTTIHIHYFSDRTKGMRQSDNPVCDQIYIEAIGSNGVLYFNTDSVPSTTDLIRIGTFAIDETMNRRIPVLQAVIDGIEIRDILPKSNEVPIKINVVEEKLKFYEYLLEKKLQPVKISRLFKDAVLFKTKIIQSMKCSGELSISKEYWK